ncbi:putative guanine deaminase [Triangularia verruculosa]|uniref:Guanine deaminase n=1 Tax=Triangularia verruculosa TaxID=2587418 RepID=A0AAN6XB06_9PEZI|nr:putative guanine deaminase [Triangularia verruculosa]
MGDIGLPTATAQSVVSSSTAIQPPAKNKLFLGTFIHSKTLAKLEFLHNAAVAVNKLGTIVAVSPDTDFAKAQNSLLPQLKWASDDTEITAAKPGQFFFPGFIDTHLHASQYPNVGLFGNSTLLDWLNTYTFPLEASLSDIPKAQKVYSRVIRKTLSHGTTTAAYYATIDVPATNLLADLCLSLGQRALIGRVCMDQLGPTYYLDESPAESITKTKECIQHVLAKDPKMELITPIITPRFAPACSAPLMKELGQLARETDLPVQTHISENKNEIALVASLFPDAGKSYAEVYDTFGLLTDKTILAHAVHLTEKEADLVKKRKSKVSHCPCSNSAITSGAARVRWLLDKGIEVGLGTDMSGGYSPSVLEAARHAVLVSRHICMDEGSSEERDKLSVEEVLHLATRGGAKVVGMEDKIGGWEVGKEWDAQLVGLHEVDSEDDGDEEGNVDVFGWESWEEKVAKWVYNGDDRNTKKVWVRGRLVHERR